MSEAPALLVAVTGQPGEGKTRLLASLADDFTARHRRVAGLLALAGERPDPSRGALSYRLRLVGEEGDLPWAERDEGRTPPYRFDAATFARLETWARRLGAGPSPELLVLDEFGPCEAAGGGLMPLWPLCLAARPGIVVLSVRPAALEAVERRLGRDFDLHLPVHDPATPRRLRQACADFGEWTGLGLWGGAAGACELSLGSSLHALRVPLRGAALSAVQATMLTFASAGLAAPGRVVWVAGIAAGLKAFAPGGGRVRPMVAICVQGSIFATAVQLIGWNILGVVVGGAGIGAWAALQGFLVQYLLLGQDLVDAYARVSRWLVDLGFVSLPSWSVLIGGWAVFHGALAAGAAGAAWRLRVPPPRLRRLWAQAEPLSTAQPALPKPLLARWAREFARWPFWVPLVLVVAVLFATGRPWEDLAWLVIRFLAVGLVLFALLSLVQPTRCAAALRRRGWWGPAAAFAAAWASRHTER